MALVLRVGAVILTPHYTLVSDSLDYHRHAVSIAHGHGFPQSGLAQSGPSAFRPPLYPYLLGGVYVVSGDHVTAARLAGAVLGVLTVLLLLLVGEVGWNRRVGLLAAALAAVFPPLVLLNASLGTETVFLPMMLSAVWATLKYRGSGKLRWAAAAGAFGGLAILTRSNGPLLALAIVLGVWWPFRRAGWRSLAPPALVVLVLGLTLVPWTVRNAVEFHRFVPVTDQSGYAIVGEYNDGAHHFPGYPGTWLAFTPAWLRANLPGYKRLDEVELGSELQSLGKDYLLDHPSYGVQATFLNTLRTFELASSAPVSVHSGLVQRGYGASAGQVVRFSFYAACLLGLVGIVTLVRRPRGARGPLFLWLAPPLMLAATAPFLGTPRYRSPLDPFVVLLAAIGLAALIDAWARARSRAGQRGFESFTASANIEWPAGNETLLSSTRSEEKTR